MLSAFGLVPAAAAGIDVAKLVASARMMMRSCGPDVPPPENPGVQLGIALGIAAREGRDKVTISASPSLASFGAWAEQLFAKSTGKHGKGLIPVDGEPLGAPDVYGNDRVFIDLRLDGEAAEHETKLATLEKAGHPVVRIVQRSVNHIGQEFFRFEIATAVAGAIIGINPFDQPDVEASKAKTRELTSAFEKSGALPPEKPVWSDKAVALYTDGANAKALRAAGADGGAESWLKAHFSRVRSGDYVAVLAYVARDAANTAALQKIRLTLRDARHVATCLGFGPRFLHSTGQAYKGGPDSGVFLQITSDDAEDLAIPAHRATFGIVKAAQARGDFEVLAERGRRALRIHLKGDVDAGLRALDTRGAARVEIIGVVAMQIGMVGLGRMGGNIARRLMQHGHEAVVYDRDAKAVAALSKDGASGASGLDKLVKELRPPRAVWVMLPAGEITETTIVELGKLLEAGDIVIDGGNTFWKDDIRRAKTAAKRATSTTSMSAPAAACGDSSAAIA